MTDINCCLKQPTPDKPSSLGAGSVLLIMYFDFSYILFKMQIINYKLIFHEFIRFFTMAGVYLIVGVSYNSLVNKATGFERIPNYQFRSETSGNISVPLFKIKSLIT